MKSGSTGARGAHGIALCVVSMILGTVALGCAADATSGAEGESGAGVASDVAAAEDAKVAPEGTLLTGTVSGVGQLVGICAPLTCCFPVGAEWNDNAFENGLRALGCTTPQAYSERYGSSNWWMYSKCTSSAALTALVNQYSKVAPFNATITINECLLLTSILHLKLSDVFVAFDPTCTSCKSLVAR